MVEVCNCYDCGGNFNLAGAMEVTRTLYNINVKEKRCPHCGSQHWEPIGRRRFLDKYLQFADNGYYNPLYEADGTIKIRR